MAAQNMIDILIDDSSLSAQINKINEHVNSVYQSINSLGDGVNSKINSLSFDNLSAVITNTEDGILKMTTSLGNQDFGGFSGSLAETIGGISETIANANFDDLQAKLFKTASAITEIDQSTDAASFFDNIGKAAQAAGAVIGSAQLDSYINEFTNSMSTMSSMAGQITEVAGMLQQFSGVVDLVTDSQKRKALWDNIVSTATKIWSGVQAVFNAIMAMNPIMLVIMLVVALIGAIVLIASKTEGWGKQWDRFTNMAKASFSILVDSFMIGINKIMIGWYKFKSLFGSSDENNKMISQLNKDVERRKNEIDTAKKTLKDNAKWEVSLKKNEEQDPLKSISAGSKNPQFSKPPAIDFASSSAGSPASSGYEMQTPSSESGQKAKKKASSIVINMEKMIENVVFNGTVQDNIREIESQFEEALMRVLQRVETA